MWHCSEFLFLLVLLFFQRWHWKVTENGAEAAVGTVSSCLPLPDIINYYWCKLWPHFPLHHPISSRLKSAHRIFAYMHIYNPSFMQVNQKRRDCNRNAENSLTAYSSGVTFSTSNTTASKLFFSSDDALSLRDSELLLFWKSHTQKHTHTNWWLGFWELDYQMKKSGDVGKVLRFVKWTPRKTKHNILKCYYLICQLTNTNI